MIARWPGKIAAGSMTDHVSGFQDVLPTLVDVAGGKPPTDIDGISYLPTLRGGKGQKKHEQLVWEFFGYGGQQAVRAGKWKAVRQRLKKGNRKIMLFDMEKDRDETTDVAAQHPEIVAKMDRIMRTERTTQPDFPIPMLDGKKD